MIPFKKEPDKANPFSGSGSFTWCDVRIQFFVFLVVEQIYDNQRNVQGMIIDVYNNVGLPKVLLLIFIYQRCGMSL